MSAAISPAMGRSYGVQRVCRVWVRPPRLVLSRGKPQHGAAACTTRSGAAGRGSEPVGGDQSRPRELAVPRRGAPKGLGPAALRSATVDRFFHFEMVFGLTL